MLIFIVSWLNSLLNYILFIIDYAHSKYMLVTSESLYEQVLIIDHADVIAMQVQFVIDFLDRFVFLAGQTIESHNYITSSLLFPL